MSSVAEIVRTSKRKKTKVIDYYENEMGKSKNCSKNIYGIGYMLSLKQAPNPSFKNKEIDPYIDTSLGTQHCQGYLKLLPPFTRT